MTNDRICIWYSLFFKSIVICLLCEGASSSLPLRTFKFHHFTIIVSKSTYLQAPGQTYARSARRDSLCVRKKELLCTVQYAVATTPRRTRDSPDT